MPDGIKTRPRTRALKLFFFFYFSTLGLFLPFLPLLFNYHGLADWQVGILLSLGPLAVITMQPAWGFASDRLKIVKKLIVIQLVASAVLSVNHYGRCAMKVSLILAHPNRESLNHAIAGAAAGALRDNGHQFFFHDLYEEGFNPVLPGSEIPREAPLDTVVENYCREISLADGIIIVHPNWWGQPPAILKGWVDRVIRPGVAYEFLEGDGGGGVPAGLLRAGTAVVFNTSNTPPEREKDVFGDPLEAIWRDCVFGLCGVKNFYRKMYGVVVTSSPEERGRWLEEVRETVSRLFPGETAGCREEGPSVIRRCLESDFKTIHAIINDSATVYRGVIPADCWSDPYMPEDELRHEIGRGVTFWGYQEGGELLGVMGLQNVLDVTLIRHAYVRTASRNRGIGGKLLAFLLKQTGRAVLIGTWADAVWAVRFYQKHGFSLVSPEEKDRLLKKYWSIPRRQVKTSVVLARTTG